ncbi:MAG TPA: FG-GAP-like repeat-containing protein [Myxococcota bacterium]|nr:FG-GAP-like repeat-containing protein [Myxococcota bacterium]
MRVVPWLLLLACSGKAPDDSTPPAGDDSDAPSDTDPPVTHTDETDPPALGSRLTPSGPIVCANPTERGSIGMFNERAVPFLAPTHVHLEGGNAAIGDLDGNGRLDTIVVGQTEVLMFLQDGPLLEAEPVRLVREPWVSDVRGLFGATIVDYDDDGDLDVLVTGRGVPDHLLANDGYAHFVDMTDVAGLTKPAGHHSTGASFNDFDGDGVLDLYIGGHGYVDEEQATPATFGSGDPERLYKGNGDGTFTDVSDRLPQSAHDGYTFMGGWIDIDHDGDDDLYQVNDFGGNKEPCRLLFNDGGTFRADDDVSGIDAHVAGMGLAIGDLDGDGDEDLAIPAWKRNMLFVEADGLYFESAHLWGWDPVLPQAVGWGAEMVDAQNDGLMDLTTAYGFLDTHFGNDNQTRQPDGLYLQVGDHQLADRAAAPGFNDLAPNRAMAPGDLNQDGWLDFVKPGLDGNIRFYLSRCGTESWIEITLRQPAPNTWAVGGTVRLFAGGRQWVRRVRAGGTGYGGGQPLELHFGLGDVARLDRVEVTWPDGAVESWSDVDARQRITITR